MHNVNDRCENCRFWECLAENSSLGVCRRHAPQSLLVPREFLGSLTLVWPETHCDECCGEHQPLTDADFLDPDSIDFDEVKSDLLFAPPTEPLLVPNRHEVGYPSAQRADPLDQPLVLDHPDQE